MRPAFSRRRVYCIELPRERPSRCIHACANFLTCQSENWVCALPGGLAHVLYSRHQMNVFVSMAWVTYKSCPCVTSQITGEPSDLDWSGYISNDIFKKRWCIRQRHRTSNDFHAVCFPIVVQTKRALIWLDRIHHHRKPDAFRIRTQSNWTGLPQPDDLKCR